MKHHEGELAGANQLKADTLNLSVNILWIIYTRLPHDSSLSK